VMTRRRQQTSMELVLRTVTNKTVVTRNTSCHWQCDRRTDRQTDRWTDILRQHSPRYAFTFLLSSSPPLLFCSFSPLPYTPSLSTLPSPPYREASAPLSKARRSGGAKALQAGPEAPVTNVFRMAIFWTNETCLAATTSVLFVWTKMS